jgi:hypothetical protein
MNVEFGSSDQNAKSPALIIAEYYTHEVDGILHAQLLPDICTVKFDGAPADAKNSSRFFT